MENLAKIDAPIHELLARRWSPRAFAERDVDPAALRSLLEAARWAPSSFNAQPWAFLVATRRDPAEHERLVSVLSEGNRIWAQQAPVLMLSLAQLNFARDGKPNRHAWHDVGLATGHLMIQATAMGLVVHAMAGFSPEKARELYAIPPGWEPVAALAVGYPGEPGRLPEHLRDRERAPRVRKPIEEFVFTGRWGQRAALAAKELQA